MCFGEYLRFRHVEIESHLFRGIYAGQTCRDRLTFVAGNICISDM